MKEKKKRSLGKTGTWRVLATAITVLIVYFVTRNVVIASVTGLFSSFVKTALYYLHERVWEKTDWGRQP
jgi:uncharacterized membrane protein